MIFEVLISASAVIFKGIDSLSAFTIRVASLYSVMRSRFNVTVTALLLPAARIPVAGFTLNQSYLSNPLIFQLNCLFPLFWILKASEEFWLPKFNELTLSSNLPSKTIGVNWISPDTSRPVITVTVLLLVVYPLLRA